jgi:CBS domain-containing protein
MSTQVIVIPASLPVKELLRQYFLGGSQKHQGYPVVDTNGQLLGVVTRTNLVEDWVASALAGGHDSDLSATDPIITFDLIHREPIVAYPDESCRTAAERMAAAGVGRLPVVALDDRKRVIGIVTRSDLLKPRARHVEEEVKRERFIATRANGRS